MDEEMSGPNNTRCVVVKISKYIWNLYVKENSEKTTVIFYRRM